MLEAEARCGGNRKGELVSVYAVYRVYTVLAVYGVYLARGYSIYIVIILER